MKNPNEDYYNRKNDERFLHFRSSLIGIAILLVIASIFSVGYLNYKVIKQVTYRRTCNGYTVLDAQRVIWCDGDTTVYDWHLKLKGLAK